MSLLLFLIWLFGLGYSFLILSFYRNLPSNRMNNAQRKLTKKVVAVVIPFRNEEENLKTLCNSLSTQSYPNELTKYYFINDHSSDKSKEIIEKFAFQNPNLNVNILDLKEGEKGKKVALQKAYQVLDAEIIINTDADCIVPVDWIKTSINAFENENVQMLCGGIKIKSSANWIEQFQSVELMSLIGSGAAAIQMNRPIMNNGANLTFRKSVLDKIYFSNIQPISPSGDDVFLMMAVSKEFGAKAIKFEFDPKHWVDTNAVRSFEELVQQRIRWTSKSKNYTSSFQLFVSLIVLLSNFCIPFLFTWSLFSTGILLHFALYWALKLIIDYFFLKKVSELSEQQLTYSSYFQTALLYPFFISYIAIIGQFASFKWKERTYQNK